jgi:alkylhydroperoxidase family enzyme
MLAHGAVLRKNFFNAAELIAIVKDYQHAGLTDEEVALMSFAQKVTLDPAVITPHDMDELRVYGLTDEDILDVVLACTARSFFSKTLDALGAVPDESYRSLEPELYQALAIGRIFA